MNISFLIDKFSANSENPAIIWKDQEYKYKDLLEEIEHCRKTLNFEGAVVAVKADFSPKATALLLSLIEKNCIIVPLSESIKAKHDEFSEIAEAEYEIVINSDESIEINKTKRVAKSEIINSLKKQAHPGLVLFSSGSTGKSKAAVHDFTPLLEKFKTPRHQMRAIAFLLFDHIGGVNTLLYNLSNAGCIVTVQTRDPATVCASIEKWKVETLPTSPTFLNLLLLSGAFENYDLSSLNLVTYGTEVMPESVLTRFSKTFPNIRLLQTYGLSELGILRSKSKSSDSLWVKVGGEGFETRVADGLLEIKAESAMLGYLNAPSPFTEDGWFKTGDAVEVDGEYLKILGRKSEIINVGGEKVYPAEVESVIQSLSNVEDVVVKGEENAITGNIVKAIVKLKSEERISDFRKRMRAHCKNELPAFKIPQKIEIANSYSHGQRFKKMR